MDTSKSSLIELKITATHFFISRFPCQFLPCCSAPRFAPKEETISTLLFLLHPLSNVVAGRKRAYKTVAIVPFAEYCSATIVSQVILLSELRISAKVRFNSHHCQASLQWVLIGMKASIRAPHRNAAAQRLYSWYDAWCSSRQSPNALLSSPTPQDATAAKLLWNLRIVRMMHTKNMDAGRSLRVRRRGSYQLKATPLHPWFSLHSKWVPYSLGC